MYRAIIFSMIIMEQELQVQFLEHKDLGEGLWSRSSRRDTGVGAAGGGSEDGRRGG